ncbi:HXXEE domain-containing protein [Domibacillus epiphyticus]|nr:HXXEE domain-containing protein [Domibacillus epiphyticus]
MFQLELYNAIWLFVVIFMLHDFEEIIAVEKWAKRKMWSWVEILRK